MPNQYGWTVVGVAAAILTSTSFIPQIILRLRNPRHARMSYGTLLAFLSGAALWTSYGLHLRDWIIVAANLFIISNLLFLAIVQIVQEKETAGTQELEQ